MSRRGHLSVQDIKGRFETLPDFPHKNNISSGDHRRYQKRNGVEVSFPSERFIEVQRDEDQDELFEEENVSSRLRSLSVGTATYRGGHVDDVEKGDTSKKRAIRNHSFNKDKRNQNGKLYYQDSSKNYASYNFSSFSEKQKLVENIVMNIRNNVKKAEDDERKTKDSKTRDIFSITSKLEKDLKNVIEKGSRLKWNSKTSLNKSYYEEKGNECSPKSDTSINVSKYEPIQNSYSEKNETGVRLLSPFRTYSNDALDAPDKEVKFTGFRSRSSPDLLRKSNKDKTRLKSSEESINHLDSSQSSNSSQCKEESSHENNFYDTKKSLRESSPVRPPRRMKKKAPLPPPLQNNFHESAFSKENFKDCLDSVLHKKEDKDFFKVNGDRHMFNDSLIVSRHQKLRNSLCEVNDDFNYEEQCEKTLEGNQFSHFKLTASVSLDSCSRFRSLDSCSPSNKNNNNNNDSLQLHPLPMGSPPKKPPRTFAYDIYHSIKKEKKPQVPSSPPPKLTEEEIESLYSKPIKRQKDKSVPPLSLENSSHLDKINGKPPPAKPTIAPKPRDLLSKSKKRLSAVEPLTQNQNDFGIEKPSIKRNSSFRFSFKKNNKPIGPHLRQISPRRELKIGKKLKNVVRNFSPKRTERDKRVRFQSDYEDVINEDAVVYATPITKEAKSKESPQELHYMCSPLFEDKENDAVHHKENRPPSSPRHSYRPGLMDGLREELRQSCRFVQKRLKSTPNARRKYKAVSTPRH